MELFTETLLGDTYFPTSYVQSHPLICKIHSVATYSFLLEKPMPGGQTATLSACYVPSLV